MTAELFSIWISSLWSEGKSLLIQTFFGCRLAHLPRIVLRGRIFFEFLMNVANRGLVDILRLLYQFALRLLVTFDKGIECFLGHFPRPVI